MRKPRACVCAVSCSGKVRPNNEDNLSVDGRDFTKNELDSDVFFVENMTVPMVLGLFDGMGGEEYGEVASAIGVNTLNKYRRTIVKSRAKDLSVINACFQEANEVVCREIISTGKRIGTTASILCVFRDKLIAANVGDSRIYRFLSGILTQLSVDHTEYQSLLTAGLLPAEELKSSKSKNTLTQHLGIFPDEMVIEPAFFEIRFGRDNVFLLCSDGLTDMVDDARIADIMATSSGSEAIAKNLVNTAIENGGKDNVTVIIVTFPPK